ncbi:phage specificity protein [Limosilactobacillus reuteri]|uniref:phage specificity protein n=1 Tax=Limosilactobacillus reuteri TaxID=1598 RepID=UPI001CDAD3EA|nr:phage specificity protein [Limosilactobacillus reuteri]
MEKTIKYLENGEYHYATVRSVGDLAQLKTDSKETLVEAINELWNGGGNADPSKAPKPEGYDQLVQDVADAVKNQQEISQQWIEWQNEEAQLTEERKQAYLQAMKEMQEAIDKAKADAAALDDKTAKLDEQITKTFSDLDTSIQNMHEQLQKEADRMNKDLQDTKGALSTMRTDLQSAQMDNGKIHDELTNINGKFEHKVWQTDLDPLKEQIERAETSVQQTKDELLGKASRQDLDTVSNTVSKLDTQLKETAKGVEISVKKDELGGEIAEALTNKTNILLGTRRFTGNWWKQGDHVKFLDDPWKGFVVAEQTGDGSDTHTGITQAIDVKAGITYVFSAYVWIKGDFGQFLPILQLDKDDVPELLGKIDSPSLPLMDVTEEPKRFSMTFTPHEDCTVYPHVFTYYFQEGNAIYSCGYQLEIGKEMTPWEPNQQDVGEYVEKTEAKFNVYNDKIQALTEKQRQQGDTQEKLRTEVTQTAEGVKQVSESLKDTNGDITKLRGDLERTADHMKSEYVTYTNKAVGQISDSTLNLIRNSSFQNKDEDFAQWQNISAKANIRQDENGLRWVELTQSGMTTDNIVGLTSNYFNIKQGKVTVAVDIKSGTKADLDIESVLTLELYDENKKRVDFTRLTLNDLGLNKSLLGDHQVHRGLYRLGIDRNDAKYMTVKALLARNGDLYFTNFSARLSSIDDGAYEPNPDDINQQILKQNTKIEQNAKEVAIKANSVDVTRDIKSAVDGIKVGTSNLLHHSDTFDGWHKGASVSISNEKYLNGSVAILNNSGSGGNALDSVLDVTNDEKYITWTVYAKADVAGDKLHTELWGGGGYTDQPLTTKWQRYKFAGNHADSNHGFYLWGVNSNKGKVYVALPFAVIGNATGTWTPNAGDTSAEIKSAKDAAIQVASDQINIHVNELSTSFDDKLNKRVNEVKTASEKFTSDGIEQTVTKITNVKNDVDRLGDSISGQNGGSNLAKGTSLDEKSGKSYEIIRYKIPGGIGPGTYTLSGWAKVDQNAINHKQNIFIDPYTDNWSWSTMLTIEKSLDWKYGKLTFTIPQGQIVKNLGVYLSHPDGGTNEHNNDAVSGVGYFKKIKLERGTNATAWTPHESEQVTHSRVSGGGVNLLKFSSFRNTTIDELKKVWYVNPDAWINQNRSIVLDNKPGKHQVMDLTQTVKLEPDTDYVLSLHLIFAQMAPGKSFGGWTFLVEKDANGNSIVPYNDNGALMVNGDQRSQNTRIIHTSPNTHQGIVYLRALPGTQVEFNEVKLEKGQIGTPWSNAPDDVSTMKQEITASVKNLGDRVTTEVNSITSKVDNMKIGGRNLLKGTRDFNSKYWYQSGDHTALADNPIDTSTKEIHSWLDWHSFKNNQTIQLDPSKNYMISADIAIYGGDGNGLYVTPYGTVDGQGSNLVGTDVNLAGFPRQVKGEGFRRIYLPVTAHGRTLKDFRIEGHGNWNAGSGSVFISKIALYEGNTPLAWSDSSDDFVEAIKEVNTKWDVANGQIQGKVTATDVNNILNGKGYATQSWAQTMFQMKSDSITLQAVRDNITNGIQNQVNNINNRVTNAQVGERNLVVGTNRGTVGWHVDPGNGTASTDIALLNGTKGLHINNTKKSTSWWVVSYPFDMGKLKPNTYYTISFDIQTSENTNGGAIIDLARGDSSGSPFIEGRGGNITTRGGEITHITRTLKTGGNIENNGQALYINSIAFGSSNVVNIANLMIVEGTQSSVWKPAPEDQGSGQNLLRGTADFSWPTGIGMNNSFEFNYERFDDSTIAMHLWNIKSNGTGIYTKWGGAFPDGQIQVGEQYTFSFDVKGSGKFLTVKNESEPGKGMLTLDGVNVPSEWARVSVAGTIQALDKAFIIYFAQGANVWIKNVKIERGAIATPWTPHPFDDKDKGVNLLKSTAYWNPADWNHISNNVWYDDGWVDSSGHKAYGHHTAWQGLGQTVYVTQGVYTWSAKIYLNGLDSNDFVYPYMGDGQYNGTAQVQDIRRPMLGVNDQNRWIDYSTTFYVKNAGNLCVRPELNRDHGNIHVGSQKLEHGMVATPWTPSPYDSDPKNIVSAINITPDQIKIASNKIVIDGNTDIHGVLRVPEVRLQGKSGMIGLDGNKGIIISSADTLFQTRVTKFGMDLLTTTNGQKEIMGGITTGFSTNNGNLNGISIVLDTQQKLGYPYGGDFFSIGNTTSIVNDDNRSWNRAMDYDASGQLHQGGFMWYEKSYLTGEGQNIYVGGVRGNGNSAYDPILIGTHQWDKAAQSNVPQPLITLGYGGTSNSNSGLGLVWNQMKPYGNWDITDVNDIWYDGQHFRFTWVSHPEMMSNASCPAFIRLDGNGAIASGICFAWGSVWAMGAARGGNIVKLLL